MSNRHFNILLVEDNPGDIRLIQEALSENAFRTRLHIVQDGEEAIRFLNHYGSYKFTPVPDLVLLDWNLPKRNGREVLENIKSNPVLMNIPVIILTSSSAEQDIFQAYQLKANCFVTKPGDYDCYVQMVKSIGTFWLKIFLDKKN